jgi:hypothetical protein
VGSNARYWRKPALTGTSSDALVKSIPASAGNFLLPVAGSQGYPKIGGFDEVSGEEVSQGRHQARQAGLACAIAISREGWLDETRDHRRLCEVNMTVLGQPEPLQPTDTTDRATRISVDTRYSPVEFVDRVEFECTKCHTRYWREVVLEEKYDEVVYYMGLGPYALNPTTRTVYAPNSHECGDPPSL